MNNENVADAVNEKLEEKEDVESVNLLDFVSQTSKEFILEYAQLIQKHGLFIGSLTPQCIIDAHDNPELVETHLSQIVGYDAVVKHHSGIS